jgi:hypothetical protein
MPVARIRIPIGTGNDLTYCVIIPGGEDDVGDRTAIGNKGSINVKPGVGGKLNPCTGLYFKSTTRIDGNVAVDVVSIRIVPVLSRNVTAGGHIGLGGMGEKE